MREVLTDSFGYAGAKMTRRVVGIAHVADLGEHQGSGREGEVREARAGVRQEVHAGGEGAQHRGRGGHGGGAQGVIGFNDMRSRTRERAPCAQVTKFGAGAIPDWRRFSPPLAPPPFRHIAHSSRGVSCGDLTRPRRYEGQKDRGQAKIGRRRR